MNTSDICAAPAIFVPFGDKQFHQDGLTAASFRNFENSLIALGANPVYCHRSPSDLIKRKAPHCLSAAPANRQGVTGFTLALEPYVEDDKAKYIEAIADGVKEPIELLHKRLVKIGGTYHLPLTYLCQGMDELGKGLIVLKSMLNNVEEFQAYPKQVDGFHLMMAYGKYNSSTFTIPLFYAEDPETKGVTFYLGFG